VSKVQLTEGDCAAIGEAIAKALAPIRARLDKLEGERLKFAGTWKPDKSYEAGSVVTHGGGLWHANIASKSFRPGTGSAWTLAVKKGTR
jgi:hypothetical protein